MWGSPWALVEQAPVGRALMGWALLGQALMGKALMWAGPRPDMSRALMGQALMGRALAGKTLIWAGRCIMGWVLYGLGPPLWSPRTFAEPHGHRRFIAPTKGPLLAPHVPYEPHAIYWAPR